MAVTGARSPGSPTSLVSPQAEEADDRRAIAGATAANGVPDDEDTPGFATRCHRWLHVEILITGGTSVDWRLWTKRTGMSSMWCLDTRIGSAASDYAHQVLEAGPDNPQNSIIEIVGIDRVYIELLDFVASPTGVDVWLGTSGDVEGR